MSSHFASLKRGVEGFNISDFTTGTATTATDLFEFRVLDGVTPSKVEVIKALDSFKRFFENPSLVTNAAFDVSG